MRGQRHLGQVVFGLCLLLGWFAPLLAAEPTPLSYDAYRIALRAADRLDHIVAIDTREDDFGPYIALGDRFGLVRVYYLTGDGSEEIWSSKQLDGIVREVIAPDLDGDGKDELIAWTSSAMIYVWSAHDLKLRYETLPNDFTQITCLTAANVDDDPQWEIIVNADSHLYYLDGKTFNREWTSLREYQGTRIAVGDVDGDRNPELVLNTGQVIDSRTGDIKWEDQVFGTRIELVDIDGDGLPEVLTESDGLPLKIYDVDHRQEKHLQ